MDFIDYQLENKEQFWAELDDMISRQIYSSSLIESAVKSFLRFTALYVDEYLAADEDLMRCCYKFIDSPVFVKHRGHVRRKLITTLVKGTCSLQTMIIIGVILLLDGRAHVDTFEMMAEEEACRLVIDVLWHRRDYGPRLHQIFLELLYEMCRVQRLQFSDMEAVAEDFVEYLFQAVENNEDYDNDPYSYSVIRILLVLNEQYMLLVNHTPSSGKNYEPLENMVVSILAQKGSSYKTFGTNIIILLNREREPCLQLLILKMLYQLFTTESTFEYFYTNDLRVLTDVFIRELHDLPDDSETLRHTFLRVLHPMLAHSQLRHTHYKSDELVKLLRSLAGTSRSAHYLPISETTSRLVLRCMRVPWLSLGFAQDELYMKPQKQQQQQQQQQNDLGMSYLQPTDSTASSASSDSSTLSLPDMAVTLPPSPSRTGSNVKSASLARGSGLIAGEA
ncbi:hypothetical protein V1525DRAFT_407396 [Lipomyces kononenkoae]|uniref:Uncharacterized protein n=1 Tax=Lipomyces kononenkoae TaxID=34357 RepID=A0ACC3SXD8_LIPKO